MAIPNRRKLAELAVEALTELGGTARARDIRAKVVELAALTHEELEKPGPVSSRTRSKVSHGIDWAMQSLRTAGFVTHDGRRPATWSLTERGRNANDAEVFEALQGGSS